MYKLKIIIMLNSLIFTLSIFIFVIGYVLISIYYSERHFIIKRNNSVGILVNNSKISRFKIFDNNIKYSKKANENVVTFTLNNTNLDYNVICYSLDEKDLKLYVSLDYKYNKNHILNLVTYHSIDTSNHRNFMQQHLSEIIRNNVLKYSKKELFNSNICEKISADSLYELKNYLNKNNFIIEIISLYIRP